MAQQILAAATAPGASASFVVEPGRSVTLSLFPATGTELPHGNYVFWIHKLASTGELVRTSIRLDRYSTVQIVDAEGSYVVMRPALNGAVGIGVDMG